MNSTQQLHSSPAALSISAESGTRLQFTPVSKLEAAAAGLKQIRETEMIGDDGVEDLTVDIKTTTSHKVPLFKLKAWLESSDRDPREAAVKAKMRGSATLVRCDLNTKSRARRISPEAIA